MFALINYVLSGFLDVEYNSLILDTNKTMKIKGIILTALMLMVSTIASAQLWVGYKSDSVRIAEYRQDIGLDYSMPDYSVTTIDEKKIGSRLANILRYYEEVNDQNMIRRKMATILVEQNEAFEYSYFEIKKQKLMKIEKSADDITIIYRLWLDKNPANLKQVDIQYHFKDGVSESNTVNELFSHMSHYAQVREQLNNMQ